MSLSVLKRLFILALLIASLATAGFGWYMHQMFNRPLVELAEKPDVIDVMPGDGMYRVCHRMKSLGLISNVRTFCRVAMWSGYDHVIKGRYEITDVDTPKTLLDKMKSGEVVTFTISLIEGHTFKQMYQRIQENSNIVPILEGLTDQEIMARVAGDKTIHPEGQFYPDTYSFSYGVSDLDVLTRAYNKLHTVLDEEWKAKQSDLPYKNAYEALIMASIVEKETAVGEERPQIAKVFIKRLKLGMRLQTDPTVIYGMGDKYDGNITRRDLRAKTPYNTYRIDGLPPTPIAMVGRDAIKAALQPEGKDALFFVAKGDGTHYFSKTLEEHNKAVRQYQMRRSSNYRSTPNQ
ncbi:endolytic transglycosylase MltG [Litoribrevibacter albus]|uniref:Endolytic murein transglycosylase n=1 Tax=Litoribrevibacter albus TaxID=1473156 RepID=A0AA37S968_9GAMM|nr:endolytic transglycosylase MltG [Litoribrevibacter albus]GLQ31687.1 aminodeoxychorismate lyase [Litoribrevibacter albus]